MPLKSVQVRPEGTLPLRMEHHDAMDTRPLRLEDSQNASAPRRRREKRKLSLDAKRIFLVVIVPALLVALIVTIALKVRSHTPQYIPLVGLNTSTEEEPTTVSTSLAWDPTEVTASTPQSTTTAGTSQSVVVATTTTNHQAGTSPSVAVANTTTNHQAGTSQSVVVANTTTNHQAGTSPLVVIANTTTNHKAGTSPSTAIANQPVGTSPRTVIANTTTTHPSTHSTPEIIPDERCKPVLEGKSAGVGKHHATNIKISLLLDWGGTCSEAYTRFICLLYYPPSDDVDKEPCISLCETAETNCRETLADKLYLHGWPVDCTDLPDTNCST